MKVSIAIPTYKRPETLRDTLLSVRNQSRSDLVAEVIVSENSDDTASEEITKQFDDLPIRFVRRVPPSSPGKHLNILAAEARSDWLALLADDDMWGRYHLEEAFRLLTKYPEAHAYACQAANVRGADRRIKLPSWQPLASFSTAIDARYEDAWIWDSEQGALETLIRTPVNLWGIVARRQPYTKALAVFLEDNLGIDADRYMLWKLFSEGKTVIGHEVTLFYRYHNDSETNKSFAANLDRFFACSAEYTARIISECKGKGVDLEEKLQERLDRLDSTSKHEFWDAPFASTGAKNYIKEVWPRLASPFVQSESFQKLLLRCLTPPVLWNLFRNLKCAIASKLDR